MLHRQELLDLLRTCGYRYAKTYQITYEDGHIVVLFTLPAGARRAAYTAFVQDSAQGRPHLEVVPGFAIDRREQGR
jgi:hypothetical protein